MGIRRLFISFACLLLSSGCCMAGQADTAYARSGYNPMVKADSAAIRTMAQIKVDTAVVRSYNGIPVFYHCRPLHPYTRVGFMTRTTLVTYLTQAFERDNVFIFRWKK